MLDVIKFDAIIMKKDLLKDIVSRFIYHNGNWRERSFKKFIGDYNQSRQNFYKCLDNSADEWTIQTLLENNRILLLNVITG